MEYRQGCDYLFLPHGLDRPIVIEGKKIGALCINVLFKLFDECGNEIFFESEGTDPEEILLFLSDNDNKIYFFDMFNFF